MDLNVAERNIVEEIRVCQTVQMVSVICAEIDLLRAYNCWVSALALVELWAMIRSQIQRG